MNLKNGSLLLFRLFGVDVYVHWSWAFVGAFQVWRNSHPSLAASDHRHSMVFYAIEYLCLFLIVLIHEFGHALACKSVGGKAEQIVLWPLGGLAFVQPPQRAGALLWSIAAGPLVNVILLPITIAAAYLLVMLYGSHTTAADFATEIALVNLILLVFNMLPIYPLDGGQILRALIWFVAGRGMSLMISAVIRLVGAVVLGIVVTVVLNDLWLVVMVGFLGLQSFNAIKIASVMLKMEQSLRHADAVCPSCKESPPMGPYWKCSCGTRLDTFAHNGSCPSCGTVFNVVACPLCGVRNSMPMWYSTRGFTVVSSEEPPLPPATAPIL